MNKPLLDMIEAVAYEKNISIELVTQAMEQTIAALARKEQKQPLGLFSAHIDQEGQVHVWRYWNPVPVVDDPEKEKMENTSEEQLKMDIAVPKWTRQSLQFFRQTLNQKLKQGTRKIVADTWKDQVHQIVVGQIKRFDKHKIVVDLGEPAEGILPFKECCLDTDHLKIGQSIKASILSVQEEGKGSVIQLSRSSPQFLYGLLNLEIPEIDNGQIKVIALAREPGFKAKIVVKSGVGFNSSPIAVCTGMRGLRSQALSDELNGERIEFIEWKENFPEYVVSLFPPSSIQKISIDEIHHRITLGAHSENLSRIIGTKGQNIRLAKNLLGWSIDVLSLDDFEKQQEQEENEIKSLLVSTLNLDDEIAQLLIQYGFNSIEDIAYAPEADLLVIPEFDEDIIETLKERATDHLLLLEFSSTEKDESSETKTPESELASLNQITENDIHLLQQQNILTLQDLADLSLMDVVWDETRDDELAQWIIQARQKVGMI